MSRGSNGLTLPASKQEIEDRLKEISAELFANDMKERSWSYKLDRDLRRERYLLESRLKELDVPEAA